MLVVLRVLASAALLGAVRAPSSGSTSSPCRARTRCGCSRTSATWETPTAPAHHAARSMQPRAAQPGATCSTGSTRQHAPRRYTYTAAHPAIKQRANEDSDGMSQQTTNNRQHARDNVPSATCSRRRYGLDIPPAVGRRGGAAHRTYRAPPANQARKEMNR